MKKKSVKEYLGIDTTILTENKETKPNNPKRITGTNQKIMGQMMTPFMG